MEIQRTALNKINFTYPATKKSNPGNTAAPIETSRISFRAAQRRLREETIPMTLKSRSIKTEETSTVKKIVVHIDEGWDDEINVLLENGILLEFKWFADPGFSQGQQVKLIFNEDRSQLKVQVGENTLPFFCLKDKWYAHH